MVDRVRSTPPTQNPARVSQSFDFGSLEGEAQRRFDCKDDLLEKGDHALAGISGYRI